MGYVDRLPRYTSDFPFIPEPLAGAWARSLQPREVPAFGGPFMRSLYVVAVLSLGALPLAAQSGAGSGKSIKDEDIDFTSRSSLPGSMKGRLSQHFPSGYFAGLKRAATFEFNSQDQDAATQETFVFEIRPQDPTTNFPDWPAPTPAPIYTTNLTGPLGSGITAWHWTVTPATPLTIPSSTGNPFYMVWEVPINNLWTTDGV